MSSLENIKVDLGVYKRKQPIIIFIIDSSIIYNIYNIYIFICHKNVRNKFFLLFDIIWKFEFIF